MRAIEMAKVIDIETGYEFDLGDNPSGLIFEDGEMYSYDNLYEGSLNKDKKYEFVDSEGVKEICILKELFACEDLDDYEKPK